MSVPYRVYVGIKGKLEDGTDAPEDDFMARNGFKYGNIYGFAIDMTNTTNSTGPTAGVWRDEFHKSATNGDFVPGKWVAQPWRWDGEVKNFQHDGSWDYQNPPPGAEAGGALEGYHWWMSKGPDEGGCKTEHLLLSKKRLYILSPREGSSSWVHSLCSGLHLWVFWSSLPNGCPRST